METSAPALTGPVANPAAENSVSAPGSETKPTEKDTYAALDDNTKVKLKALAQSNDTRGAFLASFDSLAGR
jgi:hypothetical protein